MKNHQKNIIHIIGGGLAGSEAAWQAAELGASVILYEMRPNVKTDVHHTENFAELVCSNSFRSDDYQYNAVGLLHEEMRRANSIIMACADKHALPAGGALAVDREAFSNAVTHAIENHPNISIERVEIDSLPPKEWDNVIIATGPLTSKKLADAIVQITGKDSLSFFDAIAPIIHADSINKDIVWAQSRYDKVGPKGTGADYLNCPMNEQQYNDFIDALLAGEKTEFKEWENVPYFEGCLPIEVMAERGRETLRFGPMKPVGLTNPKDPDNKPYAVVQLRQDNALGSLWNMVGFQTKLKYGAQTEIFRTILGLEEAQFARLGGLHRNTFLNSPELLNEQLQLKQDKRLRFAGQISGVEGYVESAAMGLVTGRLAAADAFGKSLPTPQKTTALGSLVNHITGGHLLDNGGDVGEASNGCDGDKNNGEGGVQPARRERIEEVGSIANNGDLKNHLRGVGDGLEQPNGGKQKRAKSFQPMNINFGLMPDIEVIKPEGVKRWRKADRKKVKKKAISERALNDIRDWLSLFTL